MHFFSTVTGQFFRVYHADIGLDVALKSCTLQHLWLCLRWSATCRPTSCNSWWCCAAIGDHACKIFATGCHAYITAETVCRCVFASDSATGQPALRTGTIPSSLQVGSSLTITEETRSRQCRAGQLQTNLKFANYIISAGTTGPTKIKITPAVIL